MNIIIGKTGFIANKLIERSDYLFTSRSVSDEASIFLDLYDVENFDYSLLNMNTKIIFLAAISSPDECNENYKNAYKINVESTGYFISRALNKGAKVLFFSSDVVYGDTVDRADENFEIKPFGRYAEMKVEIESRFKNYNDFKVFRLSYVLSESDKYLSYLHQCVLNKEVAKIYHPFSRKVVYIDDVLEAIENILLNWEDYPQSIFNICGGEDVSRRDIADFYSRASGLKLEYTTVEPDKAFWDNRPKNINIYSLYLDKLIGRKRTDIKNAVNIIVKKDVKL
jgi:dTDP-4-dehydrorhamnose reductase